MFNIKNLTKAKDINLEGRSRDKGAVSDYDFN